MRSECQQQAQVCNLSATTSCVRMQPSRTLVCVACKPHQLVVTGCDSQQGSNRHLASATYQSSARPELPQDLLQIKPTLLHRHPVGDTCNMLQAYCRQAASLTTVPPSSLQLLTAWQMPQLRVLLAHDTELHTQSLAR